MSQPASVRKLVHTSNGGTHFYGATLEITTDPGDPEGDPPVPPTKVLVKFTFDPEDEGQMEYYRDLRAYRDDESLEVDWTENPPPPTTPRSGTLQGVYVSR